MKILLKHVHHHPSETVIAYIRHELEALKPLLQIDEARVLLEHRSSGSPPFRTAFHLATPGPDITAQAEDHTLRAALLKAFEGIRNTIQHRAQKRRRSKAESASHVSSRKAGVRGRSR
jgi:ribosome-associated translation inhibitor RaiA